MSENLTPEEVRVGAEALGDTLTSVLLRAYDESPRRYFLYCWEQKGLQWLLGLRDKYDDWPVGNDWIRTFMELNEDAINDPNGRVDFNLRAFNERRETA